MRLKTRLSTLLLATAAQIKSLDKNHLASTGNGSRFAGCNFWAWGGFAELSADHVYWQVGDDYTGDPAQEQQGLNSVFASDSSTIAIIKRYAEILHKR